MPLIVGLGNPGRRYEDTRHNIGFRVVERLGERWQVNVSERTQFNATVGDGQVHGQRCVFARPQGYMNLSGQPVAALAAFYRMPVAEMIVIHDDLDLPFPAVRCKQGGGHGGHNGLRDIHQHLGPDYLRVRFGVGRPPPGWETADHVLGRWTSEEGARLAESIDTAAEAVEAIIREGIGPAMNRFNTRPEGGRRSSPASSAANPGPRSAN